MNGGMLCYVMLLGGVKAGWANEDAPRCVIPTLVLDSHSQVMIHLPADVPMAYLFIFEDDFFPFLVL
jgi:hypothetical protein